MRNSTAGERAIIASRRFRWALKVEMAGVDGVLRNLSALASRNWVNSVRWRWNLDQPVVSGELALHRSVGGASLSPFMSASTLNFTAAGAAAGPQVDVRRALKISVATLAPGITAPISTDWREVLSGYTDKYNLGGRDPVITIPFRDAGAILQQTIVEVERVYGSTSGVDGATVMQSILTDNASLIGSTITLYVPTAITVAVRTYKLSIGTSIMDALNAIARKVGAVVRYKYDASNVLRLTFYMPDRTKVTPDYTFATSEYLAFESLEADIAGLRNVVAVPYTDSAPGGSGNRLVAWATASAGNLVQYGRQTMILGQEITSQINSTAEANTLAAAAVADTAYPYATGRATHDLTWWVEGGDLLRYAPNGKHMNANMDLAVMQYEHVIEATQQGVTARTSIVGRPNVAALYRKWIDAAQDTPFTDNVILPDFSEVATESSDGLTGTLTITPRSDLQSRVSGCTFWTTSGRGTKTALTRQTSAPFSASVSLDGSNKTPSSIEYVVDGIDAAGNPAGELRRGAVRFGVGSRPMDPDFKYTIGADGAMTVFLLGDSDTSFARAVLSTVGPPDFATINAATGSESTHGNRLGTISLAGPVLPGKPYWVGVVAYNKDSLASAPVVRSDVWMGVGVTPQAAVTVNSITAQSGRMLFNITLGNTATDLYIYVLETDTNPTGTPSVENRVATHFKDFSVGEPGIAQGVPFVVSIPILKDSDYLLVTLVPYDFMGQRGIAVPTKTAGVGGSPPAVPGAPTAAASSVTSTSVTNAVTLFGSGTVVDKIRPYVDGVAQADFDVVPDSASGTYNVVSAGLLPSTSHTFKYAAVSAAGIESASSNTLTISTAADTSGGGGGSGSNGKLATPVIASAAYSSPDQATLITVNADASWPSGTIIHVEMRNPSGAGAYSETRGSAVIPSRNIQSPFTQDASTHSLGYRVWATKAGWTDSDRTAESVVSVAVRPF